MPAEAFKDGDKVVWGNDPSPYTIKAIDGDWVWLLRDERFETCKLGALKPAPRRYVVDMTGTDVLDSEAIFRALDHARLVCDMKFELRVERLW